MSKLYLGTAPLLEKQLASCIATVKKDNPFAPVVVLVESNLVGVHLRRSLAYRMGSHCSVRFVTLSDLVSLLLRAQEDSGGEALPPFGEEWAAVLTAREAGSGYFAPVAERPGFARALLETFRNLVEAGLPQIPPGAAETAARQELQRLYDFYNESTKDFLTRPKALALARLALPAVRPFHLYIYGGYRFTPLELTLLQDLIKFLSPAVFLREAALRFSGSKKLLAFYTGHGLQPVPLQSEKGTALTNLFRLQEGIFSQGSPKGADAADDSLRFSCAPDEISEAESITREIVTLAGSGIPFREMAVAVKEPASAGLLQDKLAEAGIPAYLAAGIPLAQTRTGKSLLLFLELLDSDYARPRVMELIAYAPWNYKEIFSDGALPNPALWDLLAIEAGVVGGREQWSSRLETYHVHLSRWVQVQEAKGDGEIDWRGRLAALGYFRRFLESLFAAAEAVPRNGCWSELTGALGDFVRRFLLHAPEQQVLFRLLQNMAGLDRFGASAPLPEARALLRHALQVVTLPAGKFQQSGVNILPLTALAGLSFPVLFLPGVTSNNYPVPPRHDPLLPELETPAAKAEKLSQEALYFTLALQSAVKKAFLSWPRTDAAGDRELLPSFYLSCCGEALLGKRPGLQELHRLPGYRRLSAGAVPAAEEAVYEYDYDLACCRRPDLASKAGRYLRRLSPFLERVLDFDASARTTHFTAYQGIVGAASAGKGSNSPESGLAVTALEEYARCPYSYFLKHLLRLQPLEEPEAALGLSPARRGLLMHRILELFYRESNSRGLLPVLRFPGENEALLEEICRRELAEFARFNPPYFDLLWELEQLELVAMAQALLAWEIEAGEPFIPEHFEFNFDRVNNGAGFCLELPGGERLFLRGRIDRIDSDGKRLRVIDYKTGRKRGKNDSFEGGTALQLPVYLLAAARLCGTDPAQAEACAYFLSAGGVERVAFSGQDWPEKEQALVETIAVINGGISDSFFAPFPGANGANCRSCPYKAICGPNVEALFRRKAADPRLADFLKLKENK
jgi:RecB family exonuclease